MFANLDSDFYTLLEGGILILALYHLIIYLRYKENVFLYYGLYFVFQFLYFYCMTSKIWRLEYDLNPMLAYFPAFGFYILFTRELLETKTLLVKWDKVLCISIKCIFGIWALYGLNEFFIDSLQLQITFFYIMFLGIIVLAFLTYYKLYKKRNSIIILFLIGSVSYLLFGVLTLILVKTMYFKAIKEYHFNPFLLSYIAIFIEAILFAFITGERYIVLRQNRLALINQKKELFLDNKILINEREQLLNQKAEVEHKLKTLNKNAEKEHIVLQDKTKILLNSLLYIKSDGPYIELFTLDNKPHLVRGTLVKIVAELPANFKQCHRSYIINIDFITQANSKSVSINKVIDIPLSRKYSGML